MNEQIFQSRLVLASPETATDGDYAAILGVVGHEVHRFVDISALSFFSEFNYTYSSLLFQYFHNWTGNR
jgi:aminopeptidase N